ncbi:MAG: hypothetical protein ACLPH3_24060 [Terracidiphilus sp.]
MIDMLEFIAVLEKESAETLHSIRKIRNKASHEGRIPSGEDVAKAFTLAVNYVKEAWPELDIDIVRLLDKIESLT